MSTAKDKRVRVTVDTVEITPALIKAWKRPPFQRPLRVNDKVRKLIEELREGGGVLPGVVTLGKLDGDTYLLDGQHRIEAFLISEMPKGYADVRLADFETLGDMGREYVQLQLQLVRFRPDDVLRGLESSNAGLTLLRKKCPFIGYDQIRRGPKAPLLSMSLALRAWRGSQPDVPTGTSASAVDVANELTTDDAAALVDFLLIVFDAWEGDPEYVRLWGALNLTVCAWLWRRMVITRYSPNAFQATRDQFRKSMQSLSAKTDYLDWLTGRGLNERDRSPCFTRIKAVMSKRLADDVGHAVKLPSPDWSNWSGSSRKFG